MVSVKDNELEESRNERKKTIGQQIWKAVKNNLFTILTLLGVIIGFAIGLGVGKTKPSADTVAWIQMPGTIYIRLLQLTILPIIAANIITVMAGMNLKENGKAGAAAIGFIVGMDLLSGPVGVLVAYLMKPGLSGIEKEAVETKEPGQNDAPVTTSDVFADLFLNMCPDNIVGVAIQQHKTIRQWPFFPIKNTTKPVGTPLLGTNMIGLIFTSIAFGIAAGASGEKGRIFVEFFQSVGDTVLVLMNWFLQATPVGVCFMVAGSVVELEEVGPTFQKLGVFMGAVIVALSIHMLIQMAIYAAVALRNPFVILYKGFRVGFLSFITTAPVVAITEMLEFCDKSGIHKTISRFVIPFSVVLKGDASGVFQAVACVFIAQLTGFDITIGSYVIIAILTSFATLAIPEVPSSSIVIVITVLSSLGVRTDVVSFLFVSEWIMDRCRSGSIGFGHLYAASFAQAVATGRRDSKEDVIDAQGLGDIVLRSDF